MNLTAEILPPVRPRAERQRQTQKAGKELWRGATLNATAMVASNFRAVFTLLIARLLGPAALGIFSVAWATTDLVSKIGVLGLDDAVTTFVARAETLGDRARSRIYFVVGNVVAVLQSLVVAAILSLGITRFGPTLGLEPHMIGPLAVIVWALPGIALYRISTSASRGAKVMQHDIYSRGLTEPATTTVALLVALAAGIGTSAPEVAAIIGSVCSGLVAVIMAGRLFRSARRRSTVSLTTETRKLVAYALPIGADQFLNAFIWRIDVILLGCFVERAPGVNLTTLGIYGAVVGLANGLRRISQPFTPIFAPVVAGMTATGAHREAAATYARLLRWMLWILLPITAAMILAGDSILQIYGRGFQQGGQWLVIVAIACATNAFVNLGETVIMVQRPGLNLANSLITCAAGSATTFLLIAHFGVMGAAFGILITYGIQGLIRTIILRTVFRWHTPFEEVRPVILVGLAAIVPAVICRLVWPSMLGQIVSGLLCWAVFAAGWFQYRHSSRIFR